MLRVQREDEENGRKESQHWRRRSWATTIEFGKVKGELGVFAGPAIGERQEQKQKQCPWVHRIVVRERGLPGTERSAIALANAGVLQAHATHRKAGS